MPEAKRYTWARSVVIMLAVALGLTFATRACPAYADREHLVRDGQSLGRIAQTYGVSIADLAARNRVSRNSVLRAGQVLAVPDPGTIYVRSGQTLAGIARAHSVDPVQLARHNGLAPRAALKIGQRLQLPGSRPRDEPGNARWGVPKRRGVVTVHRIFANQTRRIRILDARGRLRAGATREMRDLMRPRDSRRRKNPHPRLLRLLAQVSDHFGGRPIHIVSGYRLPGGYTRGTSRHTAGEALDFRIPGVPLSELRAYCERFEHVGVGFYPKSRFVHLDVRRTRARWTDWSLPGQAPQLKQPDGMDDAVADGVGTDADADALSEPASDSEMADTPPAEDDGLPPVDDQADTQADSARGAERSATHRML